MGLKKINGEAYLTVGVVLIALAAVIFSAWSFFDLDSLPAVPVAGESIKQYETITTGTTADGDVEIFLTPSQQGDQLIVASTFNTHSVDLGQFNLREIISLNYDGKNILPAETFSLSGHHGSGQIIFKMEDIVDTLASFTITITGIPIIPERIYNWS